MWTTEAIEGLYKQHSYAVFRRCRRLLNNNEGEAQEMVQEVFLHFLENPQRFERRARVGTYLYAIATNRCLNRIRNRAARDEHWRRNAGEHLLAQQSPAASPGKDAEERQLVAQILTETDEDTARIALYHYVDGLSQGEIARLTQLSRITINKRLRRFRKQAREVIKERAS